MEPKNKPGDGGLLASYKTDRADPAVWLMKQVRALPRARAKGYRVRAVLDLASHLV